MVGLGHEAAERGQKRELDAVHPITESWRTVELGQSCEFPQAEDVNGQTAKETVEKYRHLCCSYLTSSDKTDRTLFSKLRRWV